MGHNTEEMTLIESIQFNDFPVVHLLLLSKEN